MQELSTEHLIGVLHKHNTKSNKSKEDEGLSICALVYSWSFENSQICYV